MVRRCSFGNCSSRPGSVVSFHSFPANSVQCAQWSQAVKMTRTDWKGPKPYSVVCSAHFNKDAFEGGWQSPLVVEQCGYRRRPKLKVNALPIDLVQVQSEAADVPVEENVVEATCSYGEIAIELPVRHLESSSSIIREFSLMLPANYRKCKLLFGLNVPKNVHVDARQTFDQW